jgi:hypothetical protein
MDSVDYQREGASVAEGGGAWRAPAILVRLGE